MKYFPGWVAALDVANATRLVRTPSGDEYPAAIYGNGGWTRSWILDDIGRGKSDDEYLPISPDEAQRLMKILDRR